MKEEFTNATGYYICFSDEGIEFKHEKEHRFFPYGSMRKLKFNNILGQVEIAGYGDSESEYFTTNAKNKEAVKSLTLEAIKKNKSAAKRPASDLDNKGKKQKPPTKEEFEKQVAEGDYLKKKDYIGNVPVAFIIIVSLIIGVTFFIIGKVNTIDDYNYYTEDLFHPTISGASNYDDELCQYPECTNIASKEVEYKLPNGADKVLSFDNSANFSVETNDFTYEPEKKHTAYDKGTYLVPQGDGSYKFENRTYKYEYTEKGKSRTVEFVNIHGLYCKDHAESARDSLLAELKDQFISKNPQFWIMCVIIPVLCLSLILFSIIRMVLLSNKYKKTIGAQANKTN